MPSPIAHSLAGVVVAWSSERLPPGLRPGRPVPHALVFSCIALAVLPDVDLLYMPIHRTVTHSVVASVVIAIIAAGVTRWVTGRVNWRIAFVCGAAYASHLVLDGLGQDYSEPQGFQALWPLSDRWFISGWDLFRRTERHRPFSVPTIAHNAITAAQEILLLGPLVLALWLTRRKGRTGRWGRTGG